MPKLTPRGRKLLAVALPVLAFLIFDLSRAPEKQWSGDLLVRGIHLYRATLSPRLGGVGVRCRFTPTCSRYSEAVIRRDGALAGTWQTLKRLGRCGPWTPAGTEDPP